MALDLMSTQEASDNFIQSELTNCTFLVEPKLDAGLGNYVAFIIMGERASTIYVRSDRKITTNSTNSLMT